MIKDIVGRKLMQQKKQTHNLKIVNHKVLSLGQLQFCRMYYWAGYFGYNEMIEFFVSSLGISPFLKLYYQRSVIDACIKGK